MIVFTPIHDIQIGGFPLSVHGLMIAAGFLLAEILARRNAKKRGIDPGLVDNASLVAIAAGFVGARLVYLLAFGQGMTIPEMLEIWNGGLSSHGGYVLGIAAGLLYVHMKKADLRVFADAVLPYLLIGWAIGRIGCFLNWDSFGASGLSSLSVVVYGEPRYPTQLFEAVGYLASFVFIRLIAIPRRFARKAGDIAALVLGLFALTRFTVDFFRGDSWEYLVLSRITTIAVIAVAVIFLFWSRKKGNP